MIWKFAFVLFMGKLSNYLYNIKISKSSKTDARVSYDQKIICKKTAHAYLWEACVYGLVFIIALLCKV